MFNKCTECGKRMIVASPVAAHDGKKFCSEACAKKWLRNNAKSDGSGGYVDNGGMSITNMLLIAWCLGLFDDGTANAGAPDDSPISSESSDDQCYSHLPDQPSVDYDTGPAVESSSSHDYNSSSDSSSSYDSSSSSDCGSSCNSGSSGGD